MTGGEPEHTHNKRWSNEERKYIHKRISGWEGIGGASCQKHMCAARCWKQKKREGTDEAMWIEQIHVWQSRSNVPGSARLSTMWGEGGISVASFTPTSCKKLAWKMDQV